MALGKLTDLIDGIIKRTVREGGRDLIIDAINDAESALDRFFDDGTTSDDDFANARFLIGSLHYHLGQFNEAIIHLEKGIKFDSDYKYKAAIYLYLAGAYSHSSNNDKTIENGIKSFYLGKLTNIPLLRSHPIVYLNGLTPRLCDDGNGKFCPYDHPALEEIISKFIKKELPDEIKKVMRGMKERYGILIGDKTNEYVNIDGFGGPITMDGYLVDYVITISAQDKSSVELSFDPFGRISDIRMRKPLDFGGEEVMSTSTMTKSQFNASEFNGILRKVLTKHQFNYFCGSLDMGNESITPGGLFQRGYLYQ